MTQIEETRRILHHCAALLDVSEKYDAHNPAYVVETISDVIAQLSLLRERLVE